MNNIRKLFFILVILSLTTGFSSFYSYLNDNRDGDYLGSIDAKSIALGANNFVLLTQPLNLLLNPTVVTQIRQRKIGIGLPIINVYEQRTNENKDVYLNQSTIYVNIPQIAIVYPLTFGLKSAYQFGVGLGLGKTRDYSYALSADVLNEAGVKIGHQKVDFGGYIYTTSLALGINYLPKNIAWSMGLDLNFAKKVYQDDKVYEDNDIVGENNTHYFFEAGGMGIALKTGLVYTLSNLKITALYSFPHSVSLKDVEIVSEGQTYLGGETIVSKTTTQKTIKIRYPGRLVFGLTTSFDDDYKTKMVMSVVNSLYGSQYKYNNNLEPGYRNVLELHLGFSHLIRNRPIYYGIVLEPSYVQKHEINALYFTGGTSVKILSYMLDISFRWGSRTFTNYVSETVKEKVTEHILDIAFTTNFEI